MVIFDTVIIPQFLYCILHSALFIHSIVSPLQMYSFTAQFSKHKIIYYDHPVLFETDG